MKIIQISILLVFMVSGCSVSVNTDGVSSDPRAKFEPEDGKCIVFIGQDMGSIGGIEGYNDGYVDAFGAPAGITAYTNFTTGGETFGWENMGVDGVFSKANWGAGDCYADLQIKHPTFKNSVLAIGLSIVGSEKSIVIGDVDNQIDKLANWIKELSPRPVFLRIGYEYDGHAWNHYDQNYYPKAWRYIIDKFTVLGVENVAFVWQSTGVGTSAEQMEEWYPGDRYVDWCGYSYFSNPDTEMIKFARKHGKPVFIAELSPCLQGPNNTFLDTNFENNESAKKVWDEWFTKFFRTIKENDDVVKAFSYINCDWPSQAMWIDNVYFNKVDSRIQKSEYISEKWTKEMNSERYLKANTELFEYLNKN